MVKTMVIKVRKSWTGILAYLGRWEKFSEPQYIYFNKVTRILESLNAVWGLLFYLENISWALGAVWPLGYRSEANSTDRYSVEALLRKERYIGNAVIKIRLPMRELPEVQVWSESGRFPGEGHANPLQHSCLENPMDRRAWWTAVHGVTKSQTWLTDWACPHYTRKQIRKFFI